MIIDSFCYFNEEEVLRARLAELYPVVDKFVLVEAELTQTRIPKPLFFDLAKHKFEKYLDKIVHVKVSEFPSSDNPWRAENFQRSCIRLGLDKLELQDSDTILISDLDEIPKAKVVKSLVNLSVPQVIGMRYVVYKWNLQVKNFEWRGTVAVPWSIAKLYDIHDLIKLRDNFSDNNIIHDGGWHLGYQGGPEMIFRKYFSAIEPFDKSRVPSWETFLQVFNERAVNGGHFIFCDELDKKTLSLEEIPTDILPDYIRETKFT